jgi:hypothetical protein
VCYREETVYFLCEYTEDLEHYNYGFHAENDKGIFLKEISDALVFDLL